MAWPRWTTVTILLLATIAGQGLQFAVATTCQNVDEEALSAFKSGITSDPTGILGNWNSSFDCCSWYNVLCNAAGHVISLNLRPDPGFDDNTTYLRGITVNALRVDYSRLQVVNHERDGRHCPDMVNIWFYLAIEGRPSSFALLKGPLLSSFSPKIQ